MGQGCATNFNETNAYQITRSRERGPGFFIYHESTMIIGVTDERLIREGLKPGSTLTHINDEEVNNLEDYRRLANRARFTIRVKSLQESNTYKIIHQSKNPGIVVDTNLMVSDVEDEKDRIHLNRTVERVNGVALNGNFKKFREMTTDQDIYYITLSLGRKHIPAETLCNAIMTYNRDLNSKITSEVQTRFDHLMRWQQLLSQMRAMTTESNQGQRALVVEHVVSGR